MPYKPLEYKHISDPFLLDVFGRADLFLKDVYGMFALPAPTLPGAGGGNWAIALVLVCIIDGISRHVYPAEATVRGQEQRFKYLIRTKLYWGSPKKGWYDKAKAAAVLYTELRNPLVHELALDKPAKARPRDYYETVVAKWGEGTAHDIEAIDSRPAWNEDWPTLAVQSHDDGERLKLSCAALYWSVKQMINDLAADPAIIAAAVSARNTNWAGRRSLVKRLCRLLRVT
jgi:hypothetical protein